MEELSFVFGGAYHETLGILVSRIMIRNLALLCRITGFRNPFVAANAPLVERVLLQCDVC